MLLTLLPTDKCGGGGDMCALLTRSEGLCEYSSTVQGLREVGLEVDISRAIDS